MQLHGFQWALEVVSGSVCSVKHIWLIIQVWKHRIPMLSVLWKAWQEYDDCIQVEKKLPLLVFPIWENAAWFIISVWHMYHVNTNVYVYLPMYNEISAFHNLDCTAWQCDNSKYEKSVCLHTNTQYLCLWKKKRKAFRLLDLSSLPDPGSLCSLHIEAVVMELQWGTKHSPEILSLGRCQESPHLNSDLLEFQNNAVFKSYDLFFFCTLLQNTGKPAKELYYLKIVGCHSSLY